MNRLRNILLIGLLSLCAHLWAQQAPIPCASQELSRLAKALRLEVQDLSDGEHLFIVSGREIRVCVCDSVVSHIGWRLFADELRRANKTLVLDFLERYLLSLKYPQNGRPVSVMLREDHVSFVRGNLSVVEKLRTDDAFAYTFSDNQYTTTWTRDGKVILQLTFPVEYQLLAGLDYAEAKNGLEKKISRFKAICPDLEQPDTTMLTRARQPGYYIQKGNFYLINDFNEHLYYHEHQGVFTLVDNVSYPLESAANMMLMPSGKKDWKLRLKHHLYGMEERQFEVSLDQWIMWCKSTGCTLYFGVESLENEQIVADVIAVCPSANFNHLLTVCIPVSVIGKKGGVIEAELYSYIPTHNLFDFFGKSKKRKRVSPKIFEN